MNTLTKSPPCIMKSLITLWKGQFLYPMGTLFFLYMLSNSILLINLLVFASAKLSATDVSKQRTRIIPEVLYSFWCYIFEELHLYSSYDMSSHGDIKEHNRVSNIQCCHFVILINKSTSCSFVVLDEIVWKMNKTNGQVSRLFYLFIVEWLLVVQFCSCYLSLQTCYYLV